MAKRKRRHADEAALKDIVREHSVARGNLIDQVERNIIRIGELQRLVAERDREVLSLRQDIERNNKAWRARQVDTRHDALVARDRATELEVQAERAHVALVNLLLTDADRAASDLSQKRHEQHVNDRMSLTNGVASAPESPR
jgi:hypothetical protein